MTINYSLCWLSLSSCNDDVLVMIVHGLCELYIGLCELYIEIRSALGILYTKGS